MRPRIGFATRRLLERAGRQVMVPLTQTCCGQPGYNSGDRQSAKALALKVMHEFENYDYVVAPSGSCAGMIRQHYPELFSDSPQRQEEIKRLVQRTYEPTDFLANGEAREHLRSLQRDCLCITTPVRVCANSESRIGRRVLAKIPRPQASKGGCAGAATIKPVCCMRGKYWRE
jgi:Cysteine-rich domain